MLVLIDCDKLNLFTGVGLVEVGGRYSYEDVAGLFGFSLPSWYGYTGVGACDYMYNWRDAAAILMIMVGACLIYESEPQHGCFAVDFTDLLPNVGLGACDRFSYKLYDEISYAIVSNVAEESVEGCGFFHVNLHNPSWFPGWEHKVVGA